MSVAAIELRLSDAELTVVGQKVFQNECAGKTSCLVHWNKGEAFPSLGIGHFIWYPTDVSGRFVESFPDLIAFMQHRSVALPQVLQGLEPFDAPWPDRDEFLQVSDSAEVDSLRQFLVQTSGLQAEFMFGRAQRSIERVIAAVIPQDRELIRRRLEALTSTPGGVYALIDYVNFKGEGLSNQERYNNQGWGLLQVLQAMGEGGTDPATALLAFRDAAGQMLTRRANNADKAIEKEIWLPGWLKRLETYRN
ncbi:hypothetical protein [Marinobacter salicampi]|uniref:hypothetical protein n=1 Tax=Marinobacter salicampi TaxID=435907 RepID=UPI001A93CC49|nr:hypothetical protein [Marinobacter salicampi]